MRPSYEELVQGIKRATVSIHACLRDCQHTDDDDLSCLLIGELQRLSGLMSRVAAWRLNNENQSQDDPPGV